MIRKYKKYLALALSTAMILESQVLTASATSSDSLDQSEEIEVAVEEAGVETAMEDEESIETKETGTDSVTADEESAVTNSDDGAYDIEEEVTFQENEGLKEGLEVGREDDYEVELEEDLQEDFDGASLLGTPDKIVTSSTDEDFEIKDGVLIKYTGTDTDVVIPDGVTEIIDGWCDTQVRTNMKSVVLPDTVTKIGDGAFWYFSNLESINLEKVENIEYSAFVSCLKLEYANLENAVEIGTDAFGGCWSLKEVVFSDELEEIKEGAFRDCYMLSEINMPNSLKQIGESAFSCRNSSNELPEMEIILPEKLEKLGGYAFQNRKISRINIPANTEVSWDFTMNAKIRQLVFEEGRQKIPATLDNYQEVKHIYIPVCVTSTGHITDHTMIHGKPGSYAQQYVDDYNHIYPRKASFFRTNLSLDACTSANIVDWGSRVEQYTWKSDDESIATVDENGVVYGVAKGSCIITVIDEEGYEIGTCQVEVGPSVNILQQPESVSASVGDTVKFTVSGTGIVGYQWYFSQNGGKTWKVSGMSGTNTDTLTVPVTAARIGQMYRCQLTGPDGDTIDSEAATIMAGLEIFMQPENVYSSVGESVAFKVGATGVQKYQWYFSQNGGKTWSISGMPGNGTSELVISVTQKRIGQKYKCVMTGANGDVLESEAATILQRPEITKQPSDVYAVAGDTVSFEITAVGAKSYQWFYSQNGGRTWTKSSMTGNKTKTLSIPVTAGRIGQKYRCQVTGLDGKVLVSNVVAIKKAASGMENPDNIVLFGDNKKE